MTSEDDERRALLETELAIMEDPYTYHDIICPQCQGTGLLGGYDGEDECSKCKGNGALTLKVPKIIDALNLPISS